LLKRIKYFPSLHELIVSRYSGLTDIRLLLAFSVILGHCRPLLEGNGSRNLGVGSFDFASMGVRGFMFLSGMLIIGSAKKHNLKRFLLRRIARIYPAFIFCLLTTILVILPIFGFANGINWRITWLDNQGSFGFLLNNMFLAIRQYQVIPYTDLFIYKGAVNGSLWSLWPEFCGYIIIYFIASISFTRAFTWFSACVILTTINLSPRLHSVFIDLVGKLPVYISSSQSSIWMGTYLCVGVVYAYCAKRIKLSPLFAILSLAMVIICSVFFPEPGAAQYLVIEITYLLAFPYLILCICWILPAFIKLSFDCSYGVYVYGFTVQQLIVYYLGSNLNYALLFILTCMLTIPISMASWFLIEKPCLKWVSTK